MSDGEELILRNSQVYKYRIHNNDMMQKYNNVVFPHFCDLRRFMRCPECGETMSFGTIGWTNQGWDCILCHVHIQSLPHTYDVLMQIKKRNSDHE